MRVATFNILHGRTVGDGVDPQRLQDCVRRLDPDILALQEVDFEQPAAGGYARARMNGIGRQYPSKMPRRTT
jgi:endonuclease/exonuclease/phosphatase family metal-dependent hydrolase